MSRVQPRVLKGFRDYLPETDGARQRMLRQVAAVFESFGFGPLTTPALEYAEILLGKVGDDGDKLLYRFEDNGGRDVALRYDLTVPLARVVAQHRHLEMPFRRYQIAPVWRAEKPGRGRFREFLQCDVDIVGEASMRADAECVMVGLEVLDALGVQGPEMRVNNRKILDGLLDGLGVDEGAGRRAVMRAIDKLPKIGRDGVSAELTEQASLDTAAQERLFDFLERDVGSRADVSALSAELESSPHGQRGVAELTELLELVDGAGYGTRVRVDLSIARGLDYYTGTIYETFVLGREEYGSIMSGGRYDTLLGLFLKESVPAVGISLGIDRLLTLLGDMDALDARRGVGDLFAALVDPSSQTWIQEVARALRKQGLKVEVSLKDQKIGKQLRYAERKGYRWVLLAGPEEAASGQVSLKDLETGHQRVLAPEDVPSAVR